MKKEDWKLKKDERPTYARIVNNDKPVIKPLELPRFEKSNRWCNED